MSNETIQNIYGNKENTEINIPVDKNNKLEIEQYAHVYMDSWQLGSLHLGDIDRSDSEYSNCHLLGKVKVTIDFSNVDTQVDVQGILIKQVKEEIKKLDADHVAARSVLDVKLSNLLAIEGY